MSLVASAFEYSKPVILFGSGEFADAYWSLWVAAFVVCLSATVCRGLSSREIIVDLMEDAKNADVVRWLSIELLVFPCD